MLKYPGRVLEFAGTAPRGRAWAVRMQSRTLPMAWENTWSWALDICAQGRSASGRGMVLQAAARDI